MRGGIRDLEVQARFTTLYLSGQTLQEIADAHGCTRQWVHFVLKRAEIPGRPNNMPRINEADLIRLVRMPHVTTVAAVARAFGCSKPAARAALDRSGKGQAVRRLFHWRIHSRSHSRSHRRRSK